MSNQAFIDGQNLFRGTSTSTPSWKIDLNRFRKYLERKYDVSEAYYFMGVVDDSQTEMYNDIQRAGFILIFRSHNPLMMTAKKGNVDTDLVFTVMRNLYKKDLKGKVILVSGDGDYFKMVSFLIDECKFEKVLFPAKNKASSLYKSLAPQYFDFLDSKSIKEKIAYKRR
ncbi:MAG: NYN domain-containing protein [Candidatus Nomurabacteria bacterium]|jgi:uncharacterized LabA/DUF88 family protein|nr:NYN domain-containing protein [Candidatus Nomurabacteria bacterium]